MFKDLHGFTIYKFTSIEKSTGLSRVLVGHGNQTLSCDSLEMGVSKTGPYWIPVLCPFIMRSNQKCKNRVMYIYI